MLLLNNLSISIEDKQIISSLSLTCNIGSNHIIMGPNGSGKSSLAFTLMAHPRYTVTSGAIIFNNQDITNLPVEKRARLGIFLALQQPLEIPGVTVFTFLHEVYRAQTKSQDSLEKFRDILKDIFTLVGLDEKFMYRALNDGFSGGEKKRFELAQLLLLKPKLAVLDELDSGLDADGVERLNQVLALIRKQNPELILIIITHYPWLFTSITPDFVHVIINGTLMKSGDYMLASHIQKNGYYEFF